MVRPEPLGSPDMTLACLRAAEVDLDLCCDGDLGRGWGQISYLVNADGLTD